MIEYPSIPNSSKAPREKCVAFDKLDGSNFRAKWTRKQGFNLFGTRSQLIDESDSFWGQMVTTFKRDCAAQLEDKFKRDKDYRDEREFVVFGEFLGVNSFAGRHIDTDAKRIVVFDVLRGHKDRKFVSPTDFVKEFQELVEIPNVVYIGNVNQDLIDSVRRNDFNLNEGVICKGTIPTGSAVGGIWSCKIKTQAYFDRLKLRFNNEWTKYAE